MKKSIFALLVVCLLGVLAGWWWVSSHAPAPDAVGWEEELVVVEVPESEFVKVETSTQTEVPEAEVVEEATPITATVEITRGDGSVIHLQSLDHEFEVLYVDANEPLQIRMALVDAVPDSPVKLEADNGGILNQSIGSVRVPVEEGGISFTYTLGGNTGKYTVYASQGNRQELMEFRVGPPPRIGEGGPPRHFRSDDLNNRQEG